MSERTQRTASGLRQKMLDKYDDGLHHKHNKNHLTYRKHFKTHPCISEDKFEKEAPLINSSTGSIREFKLRKIRKRFRSGSVH